MKLRELIIECHNYGEYAGRYTASVKYEGEKGKVSLTLDPEISDALLAFIGPAITKFSHETSKQLEKEIQISLAESTQAKALPCNS